MTVASPLQPEAKARVLKREAQDGNETKALVFVGDNPISKHAQALGLVYTTKENSDHSLMIALNEDQFYAYDPRDNIPIQLAGMTIEEAVINFMDRYGHARIGQEATTGIAFSVFLPKEKEVQEAIR